MSAERLREAARVLRERAEAATPGRWLVWDSEMASTHVVELDDGMVVRSGGDLVAFCADEFYENDPGEPTPTDDATYIATMHPGVGLALADWLDNEAGQVCCSGGCIESPIDCLQRPALAVADAILGGAS